LKNPDISQPSPNRQDFLIVRAVQASGFQPQLAAGAEKK
jgi:hypothetical protein